MLSHSFLYLILIMSSYYPLLRALSQFFPNRLLSEDVTEKRVSFICRTIMATHPIKDWNDFVVFNNLHHPNWSEQYDLFIIDGIYPMYYIVDGHSMVFRD